MEPDQEDEAGPVGQSRAWKWSRIWKMELDPEDEAGRVGQSRTWKKAWRHTLTRRRGVLALIFNDRHSCENRRKCAVIGCFSLFCFQRRGETEIPSDFNVSDHFFTTPHCQSWT